MYNIIKQKLIDEGSQAEILAIFKTGSQLFRDNPTDLDFVVILDNYEKDFGRYNWVSDEKRHDIFLKDRREVLKLLSFKLIKEQESIWKTSLYNYFFALNLECIYGEYSVDWNILDYRDEYLDYMRIQYRATIGRRVVRETLLKSWVHYYIILKIYENNSLTITEEMKVDINKLYDSAEDAGSLIEWIESKLYPTKE